jgi:hypothetical protein
MLLVIVEKFDTNLVLVNVNKLKPYKYMESKVHKQEQHMLVYWEQSTSGLEAEDFHMEVEDEACDI